MSEMNGFSAEDVRQLLEQDDRSTRFFVESESDNDDLLNLSGGSEDERDSDYAPATLGSDEEQITPPAPLPTVKRRRVSLESAPAAKKGRKIKQDRKKRSAGAGQERWHGREEKDIGPDPIKFRPARTPGPTFDTTRSWSPLSLFQLFFSGPVIRTIVENTNKNAAKRIKAGMAFKWEQLTTKDFYIFLAIIIYSGLVVLPHWSDYWRQSFPYDHDFPRVKMSRNRFEAIMWSLHLSDPDEDEENDKKRGRGEHDRLFKIKPLYTEMVNACMANFQPSQNISISERMVASKAQIHMKPYMKEKATKWGYKVFVLADSSNGYTWNFFIYEGKSQSSTTTSTHDFSYSSVMDLIPLQTLGTGYRLYVDSFYTSPTLFMDLYEQKIGCCGTIRTSRVGYPQTQINELSKKAERGDLRWIRRGKLLFVNWMDTRKVTLCSTIHSAYSKKTTRRKMKGAGARSIERIPAPDAILDNNRFMGGVDLSDALLSNYSVCHKTPKWYKSFFFHFIDIAVVNSLLLHKELFNHRQDHDQAKPLFHKEFREQLIKEMLAFAQSTCDTPSIHPPANICLPRYYENSENDVQIRRYCKRCQEAGQPRVKTAIYCNKCLVPLCMNPKNNCFLLWHEAL